MSKNNPLFKVGEVVSVDMETGEETVIEGAGMRMLPGAPGTCEYCCVKHPPEESHNRDSLSYQMKFETLHGRAPTWSDAMAHCTPEVQTLTKKALRKVMTRLGIEIPEDLK